MKKLISVLLAIALIATMSITVLAETPAKQTVEAVNGTATGKVDVKIEGDSLTNIDSVYYVVVEWDSLDFTYSFSDDETNVWDPETHTYGETDYTGANWDKTSANVTVTNHSNEAVAISAAIDTATANGVTATLSNASFNLATGVGLTPENAAKNTFTVSVAGVPTVEEDFNIGTITVTVAAAA